MWNPQTHDWDGEILREASIPQGFLPSISPSRERPYPLTKAEGPFDGTVQVAAVLPEVQAAFYGLGCEKDHDAGCAAVFSGRVFLNIGSTVQSGPNRRSDLVRLYGSASSNNPVCYESSDMESDQSQMLGIDGGLKSIHEKTKLSANRVRVSGPLSLGDSEMQALANNLKIPAERARYPETAAYGVALAAGQAVGFWENEAEARAIWQVDRTFEPNSTEIRLR
jgi:glycerol kinase